MKPQAFPTAWASLGLDATKHLPLYNARNELKLIFSQGPCFIGKDVFYYSQVLH